MLYPLSYEGILLKLRHVMIPSLTPIPYQIQNNLEEVQKSAVSQIDGVLYIDQTGDAIIRCKGKS